MRRQIGSNEARVAPVQSQRSDAAADLLRDDAELLEAFRAGDPKAQQRVLKHYGSTAARAIEKVIRNPSDVEDVLQEVLLKLLVNRNQFEGKSSYHAYVWRVAMNQAYTSLRRRPRAPIDSLEIDVADPQSSVEDKALEFEAEHEQQMHLERLREFRDSLPEEERALFDKHYLEGMGRPSLVRESGLGDKKVRGMLSRLRGKLQSWLGRAST